MAPSLDAATGYPEFFAATEDVAALAALEPPAGDPRRTWLAWYLRQSDGSRARHLLEPADAGGRGALVAAEAAILGWRLDDAQALLERARDGAGDPAAPIDAQLMDAMLASARGQAPRALTLAGAAEQAARAAGFEDRAQLARAFAAFVSVYAAPAEAAARLDAVEAAAAGSVPAIYAELTRCMFEFNRGDHAAVARRLEPLVEQARRRGMVQLQLRMQNTLAAAYSNLDDKDTAISWVERSMERARASEWPVALGEALSFLGNFYRESGQTQRAIETLEDARRTLAAAPGSRGHALACCYLAHARLDADEPQEAVARALESEASARALNAIPIVIDVLTVAGRAMARSGRAAEGVAQVRRALELARTHELPVWRIDALRALAEIHAAHDIAAPEAAAAQAPLHFLREAAATAESMGGHAEKASLLRELARAHERAGDLAAALAAERAAFEQATSDEAQRIRNRLLAAEARNQVERQRLETEAQRRLAQAQQARAEALDHANAELRKAQAELEVLASTDPMTGIANRRSFLAAAEAEVARALRYRRPMALLMCDIDRFKSINDSLGHPCGDRVITAAALTLDAGRRSTDRLGRLGGEEFALVLPETDADTAFAVAERLRESIEAARVPWDGREVRFTMSFGVAVLEPAGDAGRDPFEVLGLLIQRADAALYEAKEAGRNRLAGR